MASKSSAKTQPPEMPPENLPLLYKKPVALDTKKHANMSLNPQLNFLFAAGVNAVPLNMIELPFVMRHYPIAFTAGQPATAVAILGLRQNENLFVDDKGVWEANCYIPAYIRRYPFIFATDEKQEQLALCIDETKETLVKGKDNLLFDNDKMTPLTERALEFCKSYQAAAQQSSEFAKALDSVDILIDKSAEVKLQDGKTITLSGFRLIDEEKLIKLDEKIVAEWHKKGWLRFVYAHLLSMGNWQNLHEKLRLRTSN